MSVNSIASLSTSMAATQTNQDISMAVLKKSIDSASNGVAELLSTIPPATSAVNLPANLGQNVNTVA
jgi:putative motility protein YjfB-like